METKMRKGIATFAIAVLMALPLVAQQVVPKTAHLRSFMQEPSDEVSPGTESMLGHSILGFRVYVVEYGVRGENLHA